MRKRGEGRKQTSGEMSHLHHRILAIIQPSVIPVFYDPAVCSFFLPCKHTHTSVNEDTLLASDLLWYTKACARIKICFHRLATLYSAHILLRISPASKRLHCHHESMYDTTAVFFTAVFY